MTLKKGGPSGERRMVYEIVLRLHLRLFQSLNCGKYKESSSKRRTASVTALNKAMYISL